MIQRSKKAARPFGRLTLKQANFSMAYVETCNAAESYRRAYDCAAMSQAAIHTEALRLLQEPKVRAAIAQLQAAHRKRHEVTVDKTLDELAKIAFSDIRNVLDWGPAIAVLPADNTDEANPDYRIMHGLALKAACDISPDAAACISEVSQAKDGTLKIKLHDKLSALDKIGRHLGMFKDASQGDADQAPVADVPRATGDDHLADLAKRYAGGLKVVQGGRKSS